MLDCPNRKSVETVVVVGWIDTCGIEVQVVPVRLGVERRTPVVAVRATVVERRTVAVAIGGEEESPELSYRLSPTTMSAMESVSEAVEHLFFFPLRPVAASAGRTTYEFVSLMNSVEPFPFVLSFFMLFS